MGTLATSNITQFLKDHYSDANLLRFRELAEVNKLSWHDTDNCLLGLSDQGYHYHRPYRPFLLILSVPVHLMGPAEFEFCNLTNGGFWFGTRARTRLCQRLLPLIDAEMADRGLKILSKVPTLVEHENGALIPWRS